MAGGAVGCGPYFACARLIATAAQHWKIIDGEAALHGVNLLGLDSPQQFINALYAWCYEHVEDTDKFDHLLFTPPPGKPATPETLADEMAGFDAFAAAFGIKPPVPSVQAKEVGG